MRIPVVNVVSGRPVQSAHCLADGLGCVRFVLVATLSYMNRAHAGSRASADTDGQADTQTHGTQTRRHTQHKYRRTPSLTAAHGGKPRSPPTPSPRPFCALQITHRSGGHSTVESRLSPRLRLCVPVCISLPSPVGEDYECLALPTTVSR